MIWPPSCDGFTTGQPWGDQADDDRDSNAANNGGRHNNTFQHKRLQWYFEIMLRNDLNKKAIIRLRDAVQLWFVFMKRTRTRDAALS